jgi:hypothetical protein
MRLVWLAPRTALLKMVEDDEPARRANSGATDHGNEVVKADPSSSAPKRAAGTQLFPRIFGILAVGLTRLCVAFLVWAFLVWLLIQAIWPSRPSRN